MSASKLINRDEFVRWYTGGKTYSWIIDKYQEKYGVEIGYGTISNWRHQHGLERRSVTDPTLIPWTVLPQHRISHLLNMLRAEARRRSGQEVAPGTLDKLLGWLAMLAKTGQVVEYRPDTDEGWFLVPRKSSDRDIIRQPKRPTRERGSRD